MAKQLNIVEICRADDVDLAREYLIAAGAVDHTVKDQDGNLLTGAWLAAYLGARNVLAFFVRNGADLEFRANEASVQDLAILNTGVALGLLEGGAKPEQVVIQALFVSAFESELPKENAVAAIDLTLRRNSEFLFVDQKTQLRMFKESGALEILAPGIASFIHNPPATKTKEVRQLAKQFDAAVESLCEQIALLAARSLEMLSNHLDVFDTVICQRFRGYRKHRKWLAEAEAQAREDIARLLAEAYDAYEDDSELNDIIAVALARYPIKERVAGLAVQGVETGPVGTQFELEMRGILERAGFDVQHTGASGDQGADLIARKDGLTYVLQCKNYSSPAGNAAVQQVLGAKAFYHGDYGIVCAPNGFTKSAKTLASSVGILLVPPTLLHDLDKLKALVD